MIPSYTGTGRALSPANLESDRQNQILEGPTWMRKERGHARARPVLPPRVDTLGAPLSSFAPQCFLSI